MHAEYKREMSHSYLCLKADPSIREDAYDIQMIEQNRIPGILPFHMLHMNGELICRYDITSLQALSVFCGTGKIHRSELRDILLSLISSLIRTEDYLLSLRSLVLEPTLCFLKWDTKELFLPYLPGYERDLHHSMLELMEYLLTQIKHDDQDTVIFAYRIYHELQNPNLLLSELRSFLTDEAENSLTEQTVEPESSISGAPYYSEYAQSHHDMFRETEKPRRRFGFFRHFRKKQFHEDPLLADEFSDDSSNSAAGSDSSVSCCPVSSADSDSRTILLSDKTYPSHTNCIQPHLEPLSGEPDLVPLVLNAPDLLIGSQDGLADLVIPGPAVSHIHARIFQRGNLYFITDLSSKNGTSVNERQLNGLEEVQLSDGDLISFADCAYRFTGRATSAQ